MAAKKKPTKAQKIKRLKGQKNGLYRNINLKKLGAGKKKKAGEKSKRPTDADFKRSARTAKPTKKKGGTTRKTGFSRAKKKK